MSHPISAPLLLAVASLFLPVASAAPDPARPVAPPLAIGLNGVTSWGETWQFCDLMKHSREWRSRKDDKAWTVVEDAQGWPLSLQHTDGTTAEISPDHSIFMYFYARRIQGRVTVTWEGDGEVAVGPRSYPLAEDEFPTRNRRVYSWDWKAGSPTINVRRSNPANPVRNIRVWMPGTEDGANTFHPEWKAVLEPFPTLRFMDWNAVNGSKIAEWSERTRPDNMRQTQNGVAWEYVVQLANELEKDPWICVPHLASDDYVRQLARLLKATLKPGLRIYVEYSNEIWNGSFQQTQWLYQRAREEIAAKGLTDREGRPMKEWEYAPVLCGRRSAQVWKLMSDELGDPDRIVRTLTHFRWIEQAMAAALDPANGDARVDLIGLNGYFISQKSLGYAMREADHWNLDEAFDVLAQLILLEDAPAWRAEMAKVRRLWPAIPLTCYEGGQHFANPFAANAQGTRTTEQMIEVNGDRRIRDIYRVALESWHLAGGEGFTAFVDCGPWSKYGCWGHKEYVRQPLDDVRDEQGSVVERGAHKYAALLEYARRSGRRTSAVGPTVETTALPEAVPGEPYRATLAVRGGTAPYTWSILGGRLPNGLALAADGTISGTPKGSEQVAFLVDCTDRNGVPAAKTLGLFLPPVPPSAWKPVALDALRPIHGAPACPDSASATAGYAVRVTLTPKATPNPHQTAGFAIHGTPDGDKDDYLRVGLRGGGVALLACSRYLAGSQGELWPERRFAITADDGEPDGTTAWDTGEAWTLAAAVRPGSGKGALDLVVEVLDEQGRPRLVADRPDVANGRALLRELVLKEALMSGPWGLLLPNVEASDLRWAPLSKPTNP